MNETDIIQDVAAEKVTTPFIEYLKKAWREMPYGACREFVGHTEERLSRNIARWEEDNTCPPDLLDCHRRIRDDLRNALVIMDSVIRTHGGELTFGEDPGYNDDFAVDLALALLGCGRVGPLF